MAHHLGIIIVSGYAAPNSHDLLVQSKLLTLWPFVAIFLLQLPLQSTATTLNHPTHSKSPIFAAEHDLKDSELVGAQNSGVFESRPYSSTHLDSSSITQNDQQQNHPIHSRRRHRRRLPLGAIGSFFAKLTGRSAKVAAASADDVAAIGGRIAKNGDKLDDFVIGGTKMGKNVGKGPGGRGFATRREQYRQIDAPSFNPYSLPNEAKRARTKALTGANLALATGGVAAGIWYFSGENTTLFIVILASIVLICVGLAAALLAYCFICRRNKRGYYTVNQEEDILMAFIKKLIFYMFC